MSKIGYYEEGSWDAACDQCGLAFKFTQLRKRWDGAYVDDRCWEPRHPQEMVRAIRDNPSVPVARPSQIIYLVNSDNIPSEYVLAGEYLG